MAEPDKEQPVPRLSDASQNIFATDFEARRVRMTSWLVTHGTPSDIADDLVATAFETAMKKQIKSGDTYIDPDENVSSFLFGQMIYARREGWRETNKERERTTSLQALQEANEHFDIPTPDFEEGQIGRITAAEELKVVFTQLTPIDQIIFLLQHQGYSSSEIGKKLQLSQHAVDIRASRARMKLRETFGPQQEK